MNESTNIFARFFGVPFRGQSYVNLLYLLLALPLGVFYFVFLIGGFALGIPLILVLMGVLVLLVVFAGWVAFVAFERQLAIWLLKSDVPPYLPEGNITTGTSGFVGHILGNRATWTGLVFLFLKMPLGAFSLALVISLFGITLGSLAAPLIYQTVPMQVVLWGGQEWAVDTLGKSFILFLAGVVMIFVSFHLLNIMAWIWGWIAYWMLGVKTGMVEEVKPAPEPAPKQPEDLDAELPAAAGAGAVAVAEVEPGAGEEIDASEMPLITPPPGQDTVLIDESELPPPEPEGEKDLSPPEWLLERYDALEYYDADEPPAAAEEPESEGNMEPEEKGEEDQDQG